MKAITKTLAAVLSVAAVSAPAFAADKEYRFIGDTQFAGFCKAVATDDVRALRVNLSRNVGRIAATEREVLRMLTAEDGLTCNGSTLVDFSVQREASDVHEFLTSRS
ncbi:MAG: hypothetical protein CL587_02860 [Alteromonadaceae bacterium]|uniref:hypothetical protein n=1 Tax=Alteromonas sp. NFXS44 TaxID=2818435 RepID=UPI000C422FC8|nr:hypothetical protein [Alteromonadaceae bacterium]|tara:strand:+ start:32 stop:352 length:321 start_codon:yes stop_codon:yes gene_type:complete